MIILEEKISNGT